MPPSGATCVADGLLQRESTAQRILVFVERGTREKSQLIVGFSFWMGTGEKDILQKF